MHLDNPSGACVLGDLRDDGYERAVTPMDDHTLSEKRTCATRPHFKDILSMSTAFIRETGRKNNWHTHRWGPHSYAVAGLGRSLQRFGRVKSPSAATLQMMSKSSRLMMRKNQAFNSVAMAPAYSDKKNEELGESPFDLTCSPSFS
jgi:hypothetical protein